MKIKAYAKINLGLDVTGKREDGYHEVRMIMQTIELADVLEFERTDERRIVISTDREDLSAGEDNLIYKAAKLLMDEYDLPGGIKVQLQKNIPVAAGLAGGSTDAAATLKAVNELFKIGLSQDDLMKAGVRIGADVPYCIMGGTCLAEGIGEILTPLDPCPGWQVLIAKPSVAVSTAHVYKNLRLLDITHPDIDLIAEGIKEKDMNKVARYMGNVLESVTEREVSLIGDIKRDIKNAGGYPLMSGSGPTVFGLFKDDGGINAAYERLKQTEDISDLFITRITDGRA